ncbi:MAG TPA: 3-dehydroquinate synthase [Ktedonobacterales bacterium]|nr:3-dehydroquinate synthase [Ktedonobacterales bacterium]
MVLIGPTGSGKSSVGRLLAMLLHWQFIDLDEEIVRISGIAVPEIFAREGERGFRDRETAALKAVAERRCVVIATGAGVVERSANRALLHKHSRVVALLASAETIWRRLLEHAASPTELGRWRPMLAGSDPLQRLGSLYRRRAPLYAEADETLVVENLTPTDAAARIAASLVGRGLFPGDGAETACWLTRTQHGPDYEIVVGWNAITSLPERLKQLHLPKRLHIISDDAVGSLYEPPLMTALQEAGFAPLVCRVPVGEGSKSAAQLGAIYDWLAARRAERTEAILALGGGVVGDLAGYAAATWLRGVPLVQLPTSLLAQVDASIGGKVAINHPQGKNLIGAFYPPRLVLSDPAMLMTLPERQYIEGLAEVVKHGIAFDAAYFDEIERTATGLLRREPVALTRAIAGSAAIKAAVVQEDEREGEHDLRILLNYGHTIGHALEAVAGYGTWLHGEAVAAGMCVAARLGARLGVTPVEVVERQERLLTTLGLPTLLEGVSATALMGAIFWDKKVRSGAVRWVLPTALGHSAVVGDVPLDEVRAALLAVGAESQ